MRVALLWRRGESHADALGTLAFESRASMEPDTIFRLASMTKPITAVATPVDPYLPELG